MTSPFHLACVKVNAGNQMAANIEAADFIAFPECVAMMEMGRDAVLARARPIRHWPFFAIWQTI